MVAQAEQAIAVTAVDYKEDGETSKIIIRTRKPVPYNVDEDGNRIVVQLQDASIPEHLLRAIDTRGFGSSVLSIQPEDGAAGGGAAVSTC